MRALRRAHQTSPRAGQIGHLGVGQECTVLVKSGTGFGPVLVEHEEECRVAATVGVRKFLESRIKFSSVTIQGRFVRVKLSIKFRPWLIERLQHGIVNFVVFA